MLSPPFQLIINAICRTPPCDAELVKRQVGRVVIALLDPDKRVSGMGAQLLRDAGIQVSIGIGADQVCNTSLCCTD